MPSKPTAKPAKAAKSTKPAATPARRPVDDLSVITCDMEGRIETFGPGAERLFGYSAGEVVGKKRVSLFSPGEVVLGHVPTWLFFFNDAATTEIYTVFVRKDGTRFAARIRITPTFGHDAAGNKVQVGY